MNELLRCLKFQTPNHCADVIPPFRTPSSHILPGGKPLSHGAHPFSGTAYR